MGEAFLLRKGGAGKQALAPTITEVSKTDTSITFTITNNDDTSAVILWELGDTTPDANTIELAAETTSSNITIDSLDDDTTFIVYATANVVGKVKSELASKSITTDLTLVYTAATGGTTAEYDNGGKRYRSHTFTSDDTFTVTTAGNGDRNQVDYLIIAGGGSGGDTRTFSATGGGGGGAGGYRTTVGTQGGLGTLDPKVVVTAQAYSISVGAGGAQPGSGTRNAGTNSSALGITSNGGGGGSGVLNTPPQNGGSGGGGNSAEGNFTGGTGTANQGFNGGSVTGTNPTVLGGGGAGAAGASGNNTTTAGGNGLANLLRTGSNETRGGGGGGGFTSSVTPTSSSGGTGGGGAGATSSGATGTSGTANTGGGGGGGSPTSSGRAGAGGSGIVVIRYEIAPSV
jgi:hypothetical protein